MPELPAFLPFTLRTNFQTPKSPQGTAGLQGLGAVTTTFIAGIEAIRRGLGIPIGSLTQLATIRLGKRTENRSPLVKDFVRLADLDDLAVGTWDIFEDDAYEAAVQAGVLEMSLLNQPKDSLSAVKPVPAVFEQGYVKLINGPNVKTKDSKMNKAEMLMDDIRQFQERTCASRLVIAVVRLHRGLPRCSRRPPEPEGFRVRPAEE